MNDRSSSHGSSAESPALPIARRRDSRATGDGEALQAEPAGDPLADMLRGLRLEGADYTRSEVAAPWAFAFPQRDDAYFHFIAGGGAFVRVDDRAGQGEGWLELAAGDAVLLPRGSAHVLASAPCANAAPFPHQACRPICRDLADLQACDGAGTHLLFSGTMRFNLSGLHPLMRMMPPVMHATALMKNEKPILHLLDAIGCELHMNRVGASSIVTRLADVLAAQIIRAWVEHGCGSARGWIEAVRDPEIGRVLAAIHARPESPWNVPELARMMGASRSKFAGRFTAIIGQPPARYIAELRMDLARQWLRHDRLRVAEVAHRLGYESEAAFSRAFKRSTGTAPSHLRAAATE